MITLLLVPLSIGVSRANCQLGDPKLKFCCNTNSLAAAGQETTMVLVGVTPIVRVGAPTVGTVAMILQKPPIKV